MADQQRYTPDGLERLLVDDPRRLAEIDQALLALPYEQVRRQFGFPVKGLPDWAPEGAEERDWSQLLERRGKRLRREAEQTRRETDRELEFIARQAQWVTASSDADRLGKAIALGIQAKLLPEVLAGTLSIKEASRAADTNLTAAKAISLADKNRRDEEKHRLTIEQLQVVLAAARNPDGMVDPAKFVEAAKMLYGVQLQGKENG